MFGEAAARLGVELIYATDRCDRLEDPWGDAALAVRYHEESRSVDAVLQALEARPVNGILAVGDRPTILAAYLARLLGLPGHPPEAARAARDKRLTRERLKAGGFLAPAFISVSADADPAMVLTRVELPVVIKPTVLSGSRGVIRADDAAGFIAAFERVRRLLASPEVRELRDADAGLIQVETYIPGVEYALEGILEHGALRTLAIFDKPDALEGPFFEETIYVTPSRAPASTRLRIESEVAGAARAIGLHHGPIHAECRVNADGRLRARDRRAADRRAVREDAALLGTRRRVDRSRGIAGAPRDWRAGRPLGTRGPGFGRDDDSDSAGRDLSPRRGRGRGAWRSRGLTRCGLRRSPISSCIRCPRAPATWDSSSRARPHPRPPNRPCAPRTRCLRFTIDPLLTLLGNVAGG